MSFFSTSNKQSELIHFMYYISFFNKKIDTVETFVNFFPTSFNSLQFRSKHCLAFRAFHSHACFLYFALCVYVCL